MTNQAQVLDLKIESRIQLKRYLRKLRELALGGFAAGVILLSYSHTNFPGAAIAGKLMDKLGSEAAIPDANFIVVAIASCAVTLVATGWPPAKAFRRWFALPYLKFCFDLAGTAIGVFLPVCLAVSTPPEFAKALPIIFDGFLYLFMSSLILWGGQYALNERVQQTLQSYESPYRHALPAGAAII